jgi:hypothetical protein
MAGRAAEPRSVAGELLLAPFTASHPVRSFTPRACLRDHAAFRRSIDRAARAWFLLADRVRPVTIQMAEGPQRFVKLSAADVKKA